MRTYDNLRQKKQLLTEARAEIFAKQAKDHTDTFWAIIFCKVEKRNKDESDDESSDSGADDDDWEESGMDYGEYLRKKKLIKNYEK